MRPADYKNRNVIERGFCRLKQWRGLATRYDRLAIVYRAAVVLNAVIAWSPVDRHYPLMRTVSPLVRTPSSVVMRARSSACSALSAVSGSRHRSGS